MPRSPHAPSYVKLRTALSTARLAAGLTQQQVADKLKQPQSFVSKYESGERNLDVVEFAAVCRVLRIETSVVLDRL